MSDWRSVPELYCEHCGRELESAPATSEGAITIVGFEPMRYRHRDDHSEKCSVTVVYKAEPYDGVGQLSAWMKAGSVYGDNHEQG